MTDRTAGVRTAAPAPSSRHDHFPRGDVSRRRRMAQAAADVAACWQGEDRGPGGLLSAIDAVAALPPATAIDRLLPWLADSGWLRARIDRALTLLHADSFSRPPLRPVGGGDGPIGLILAERGPIRLTLQLRPWEVAPPPPATTLFVPGHAAIRVLATGGAHLRLHHVAVTAAEEAGGFTAATAAPCHGDALRPLRTGETLRLDTARQSFTLTGGAGDVLLLELVVQPPSCLPIRAYDIATCALVHVAASRRDSSFRSMALALLRHFGRADAAPLFAAEAESEDFAARWNAMRELVALDPAAARAPLTRMAAADPHPEVRRAAAATLVLYVPMKAAPCPA